MRDEFIENCKKTIDYLHKNNKELHDELSSLIVVGKEECIRKEYAQEISKIWYRLFVIFSFISLLSITLLILLLWKRN